MPQFESGSTKKLSISGIVAPPQTRVTTADDINNLLGTVAKTADDITKIVEDRQSNDLNNKYNQLQINYTNAMSEAGEDLEKQTQAYDTFYSEAQGLMKSTDVSDKVLSRFSSVALNDIGRIRGRHDTIRNAYNESKFYDNLTIDATTFKSLDSKAKTEWYKDKIEIGKLYNLTPNQVSEQLVKAMYNTNRASITEETPLSLLETMKSDLEVLAEKDNKLQGKDYYVQAIEGMDRYIKTKKGALEQTLTSELAFGGYDTKTQLDMVKSADYLSSDKKSLYTQLIKNKDYDNRLTISSGDWKAVLNNFEIDESTLEVMGKNRVSLDPNYTEVMYESDMFNAKKARTSYNKTKDTFDLTQQKNKAKELLNQIKSEGSYTTDPMTIQTLILTSTGDGAISQENFSFMRRYKVGYDIASSGFVNSFDSYKNNNSLVDNDATWYKDIAKTYVDNKAQTLFDNGNVQALGGMVASTKQVGTVKDIVTKSLDGSIIETAEDIQSLQTNLVKTTAILGQNIDKMDKILDKDTKKRYLLYTSQMQKGQLTKPFIDKVEAFIATPEYKNFKESSSNGQKSIKYLTDNWKGETMASFSYDKETYMALKEFGMNDKDALEAINSRYNVSRGDNYSIVGIDPEDPSINDISNTMESLASQVAVNEKDAYFTIDSNGMVLMGTKDLPGQVNLGIPIKTIRDAEGNYVQMGLKDTLAILDRYAMESGNTTFLGSKQGATNLRQAKAFMREVLVDLPTASINQLIAGDTFYQRAMSDIGSNLGKGLKSLGKEVTREINRFDAFFGIKKEK